MSSATPVPPRWFVRGDIDGFFGLALFWIARLPLNALTHPWVLYPALLVLVAYLSCFTGFAGLTYALLRRARVPAAAALPLAWLAWEQIKGADAMQRLIFAQAEAAGDDID